MSHLSDGPDVESGDELGACVVYLLRFDCMMLEVKSGERGR